MREVVSLRLLKVLGTLHLPPSVPQHSRGAETWEFGLTERTLPLNIIRSWPACVATACVRNPGAEQGLRRAFS